MKNRNINIDLLKVICILCVIFIHAVPNEIQMILGRPFYLTHAVPIFMILFGYNRVNSVERRNLEDIEELYDQQFISGQLKSIMIPFVVLWVLVEIGFWVAIDQVSFTQMFLSFLQGGRGPGGYYIVIMIQAILLFPFLYWISEQIKDKYFLIFIFVLNILIEFLCRNMNPDIYRLFISRHIFAMSLGIYLSKDEEKIQIWKWTPLILMSVIYIIVVEYQNVVFFIEHMWGSQHPFANFWTFLLAFLGLAIPMKKNKWIILIGKSSYHIFLIQKVYFMFRNEYFSSINYLVDLTISIILCVIVGVGFYQWEKSRFSFRILPSKIG